MTGDDRGRRPLRVLWRAAAPDPRPTADELPLRLPTAQRLAPIDAALRRGPTSDADGVRAIGPADLPAAVERADDPAPTPPATRPFWDLPNVVLSPHRAYATDACEHAPATAAP